MAYTAISNIINPEVLGDQITAKFPDQLVLGKTNLVDVDPEFPLGAPGTQQKLPFWKRIGAFSALTEGTAMTPGNITAAAEYLTVQRAGSAFQVLDTSELVSKADPVSEIAGQLARRAAEFIDAQLVAQIEHTPNVFDNTNAAVQTNANGTMDQNAVVNAIMTLGDNYDALLNGGRIIMHSKVKADLLKLGYIQNQYQSGLNFANGGALVPTLMGLPIEVSDLVTTETINSKLAYHTYVVGPGSLMLAYQRQVMTEFDRDILLQADVIASSVHFAPHLYGWDDNTSAVVYEQNKSIHAVVLKTY